MGLIADFIYLSDTLDNKITQYYPNSEVPEMPLYTDIFIQQIKPFIDISHYSRNIKMFNAEPALWCNHIYSVFSDLNFRCGIFPILSRFNVNLFDEWDPQIKENIEKSNSPLKFNTVRWWLEYHIKRLDNPNCRFWSKHWAEYWRIEGEWEEENRLLDMIYDENGYAREDNCKEEYTVNNLFLGEILMNKKRWF